MTEATYPCTRCCGKGRIAVYGNVMNGVCFKCNGSGEQANKPGVKSVKFAVLLKNRETGAAERIYNIAAKSSAAAIRAAEDHYERASSMFRDQYTMVGAVAVRADELDSETQP